MKADKAPPPSEIPKSLARGQEGEPSLPPRDNTLAKEAIIATLRSAYQSAEKGEVLVFEPGLDISLLLGNDGRTLKTLPLPGGSTIGKRCGIGLSAPYAEPQVEQIRKADDGSGLWVTFSALNMTGERKTVNALLPTGRTRRDAIKTEQEVQADALKSLYEQAQTGRITTALPLDVSLLIGSEGKTQMTLPLPGGNNIGRTRGIGLPKRCSKPQVEQVRKADDGSGLWVTISALNDAGERKTTNFLLLSGKAGRDVIKTEQDAQADALKALYEQALHGPITTKLPLDVSLLIGSRGSTKMTFPLPGGSTVGKQCRIGLPASIIEPQVEGLRKADNGSGLWVTFSALNNAGERKIAKVLLLSDKTGRDAVKTEQEVQADALKALYEQAQHGSITTGLPLDVSLLISSNGRTQKTLPLPGGNNIGTTPSIGLAKNLITPRTLTDILHLTDDRFRLTIVGVTSGGKSVPTNIVVSSTGIIRTVEPNNSVEIAKGYALDRYVAHLFASTDTRGITAPRYSGSPLTGECFMPNIVSGKTIVHSKWGNDGRDVLQYVQRYARLRLWHGDFEGAVHLVAAPTHLDELREALQALREEATVTPTVITDLVTWGAQTLGVASTRIKEELERISTMAAIGDLHWLSNRKYSPTLPSGAEAGEQPSLPWNERVTQLAEKPELVHVLREHKQHHSLYWERSYHLELVQHCSYLLDKVLPVSSLSAELKDEARRLIYDIYPALERYPDAWRCLEERGTQGSETDQGTGSAPYLTPFDLERELARRGVMALPGLDEKESLDWGHPSDVGPKMHELFDRHPSIEAALHHLTTELTDYSEETRALVCRECLNWITVAVLDVRLSHVLPETLFEAKEALDQSTVFLDKLKELPSDCTLSYQSNGQVLKISVERLKNEIGKLLKLSRGKDQRS